MDLAESESPLQSARTQAAASRTSARTASASPWQRRSTTPDCRPVSVPITSATNRSRSGARKRTHDSAPDGAGSAPGRDRTCDQPLRRRLLYPLSYGGSAHTLAECRNRWTGHPLLWNRWRTPHEGQGRSGRRQGSRRLGDQGFHGPVSGDGACAVRPCRLRGWRVPPSSGEVPVRTRGRRHREVPVHVGRPRRDAHDTDGQGRNRHGVHLLPGDRRVLLRPADAHGASVTLRIAPSRNGQQAGVLDAAAFRELPREVRR